MVKIHMSIMHLAIMDNHCLCFRVFKVEHIVKQATIKVYLCIIITKLDL